MRARGAVAWKLLLAIAAGIGGVWAAARVMTDAPSNAVSTETAAAVIARSDAPGADARTAPAAPAPEGSGNDPFAGVDLKSDSVLRHIAGIEEKGRSRGAAQRRPVAPPATVAARASADAPSPARVEAAPETRQRPAVIPSAPPAAPPVEAPRPVVVAAAQTQPPADPPALRAAVDATAAAAPERTIKGAATTPATVAPLPATAGRTLAAARTEAPATAPQVAAPLRVVNRTIPDFPGEAIRAGVRSGRVVARLSIDADGRVTATQVLSATPTGFFERESRRALSTWRYEPPGQPTTTDVELVFTRE